MKNNAKLFAKYLKKMEECEAQVKLVALHTLECANHAEDAASYLLLATDRMRKEVKESKDRYE